ncbi:MAG: C4-dicarboxylic acid transporter DauA [Alcanivorax sp.]|nr:C4-dicarboxylic acid transporter DauA [Alcanivorax sp.]
MPHRSHLLSLRFAHALRERLAEGYGRQDAWKDLLAGVSVGIIAIPLSMALAIASGVAPQYGLYTAIVAGFLIALSGGSRFSISGPTAAFVVILYPIAQAHGLAGLLVASLMAGAILVLMAFLRLGRLIEYISESVVLGFTAGIAVVIATLQIKDCLGLTIPSMPESYLGKVGALLQALPSTHWPSLLVAGLCLACMLLWPRLKTPIPPHLPTVILGSLVAWQLNRHGLAVETIGSRFSYSLDGLSGHGIPPTPPEFVWPWHRPGVDGAPLSWSWTLLQDLLPAAFAIAMLGAIESLLCAVVLDGMSGKRHSANSELLGQGIGNLVAPFFGGITATAAIARSSANLRANASSPIAAMIHSLVVLAGVVLLARALSWLPMPAMAALLLMVAWNMSEAPKVVKLLRNAPRDDVLVFLTCFSLTVMVDMVVAITAGILLAALLFMREIAAMTRVSDISDNARLVKTPLPDGWAVFKINGPLFFAAADRVFGELMPLSEGKRGIVLYMDGVPILDAGGLAALNRLIEDCRKQGVQLHIADLQFQPLKTLARAGITPQPNVTSYYPTLQEALAALPPG